MSFKPKNLAVWMEIPVTDMEKSVAYYNKVFDADLEVQEGGPNPMATFKTADGKGVSGHLYPGKPAAERTGPTVHMACPGKLEDAMVRVVAAGGQIVSPIIQIPPGRFVYTHDLDGNSIGVFETV